jgi:hypothetical protein
VRAPAERRRRHGHTGSTRSVRRSCRLPARQLSRSGCPTIAPAWPARFATALNITIERNERLVKELERLSTVVGKAGNVKQRAQLPSAEGAWSTAIESVNTLVSDLVQPTTEVARVIGAVAKGDLNQTMSLEIDDRR